jgi:3-methyladenine DNA glycosylase AlkC
LSGYKKLKFYFDEELAELLAEKIKDHYPGFEDRKFINDVFHAVNDLELKARVQVITERLHHYLPSNYQESVSILLKILGPENDKETGMFTEGYWLMPVALFVERYGLDDFDTSVQAIAEITKRHTSEFAVRPLLAKYPTRMLEQMKIWSKEDNVHLRRLASEGVRPRLPWARKLAQYTENPKPIIPILENLKEDHSKFVQKSVANCMNDILKDNYETAMDILRKWSKSSNPNTQWIVKHALRNELKKNNPEALKLVPSRR